MSILDKSLVVKGFSDGDSISENDVLESLMAVVSAIAFTQTASPEGHGERMRRFYAILKRTDEQEKRLLLALMKYLYQFQDPSVREAAVNDITRKVTLPME